MSPTLAYRLAKLRFLPQQLFVRVLFGVILVLGSHLLEREDERTWLRDIGVGIVTVASASWLSQQGRRRVDDKGRQLRTATMRFQPPSEGRS